MKVQTLVLCLFLPLATSQCGESAIEPVTNPTARSEAIPSSSYKLPVLTKQQLEANLSERCRDGQAKNMPVLLEFSAEWCTDCRRLAAMKQEEPLRAELERWPTIVVNVGRFDEHDTLLKTFGIDRIATWTVLRPTDCSQPVTSWTKVAQRTLEPVSHGGEQADVAGLTTWLQEYRR